LADQK